MSEETQVIYNADCPVCRFEIDAYRKRAADTPLRFHGLEMAARHGLTPDQAARRLHVIVNGQVLSGLPAFQALWRAVPRMGWLARLTALPVVRPLCAALYDHVAAPLLYHAHRRRQARAAKN